jgi:hypothetical protein
LKRRIENAGLASVRDPRRQARHRLIKAEHQPLSPPPRAAGRPVAGSGAP